MIVGFSVVVLFGLFTMQRFGTQRVGAMFGPIMALWFVTIAVLGVAEIAHEPRILQALNPWHGVVFFAANRHVAFLTLGAVVLAVTGRGGVVRGHGALRKASDSASHGSRSCCRRCS